MHEAAHAASTFVPFFIFWLNTKKKLDFQDVNIEETTLARIEHVCRTLPASSIASQVELLLLPREDIGCAISETSWHINGDVSRNLSKLNDGNNTVIIILLLLL